MTQQTRGRITAEDLYRFELISKPRLSPDGRLVVYAGKRVQKKSEKKYSNLWLGPTTGGRSWQFTSGNQVDSLPRFSPDGSVIAFLSDREDKEKPPQIYLIRLHGGESRKLSEIPGEILSMEWAPDGRSLLLTVRKFDPDELERMKDEQKKKLGVVCREYTRAFYKYDGYGYLAKERKHIWTVDARTGRATQITDHAVYDELEPTFTPDGKWIVFVSVRTADPDFTPERFDLFVIPAQGGKMRKIETPLGAKHHISVSPDGKTIAYLAHEGEAVDWKNDDVWIVPFDGSAPARNLTGKYDIHACGWTIADQGEQEFMPPVWARDGKSLYFQNDWHGRTRLMNVTVDGALKAVIEGEGVVGSFSFDREQTRMAYFFATMTDPNQIMLRDMASGKTRQLTSFNKALFDHIDLGQMKEIWYKGPDGNDLQGWILTPPGFNPRKKYPAIFQIHGGPLTQYGYFFMHEFYYLAAHDYVVFFTNPRGGQGYGWKHAKENDKNWGEKDYADLMAWADLVAKEPYVDAERMGVCGGSYGGYMTLWIVGHTQRFKAAVAMRSVANFISEWGSADVNWSFQNELSGKPPYVDLKVYWDHSPMKYIGNVKTPTKIIHNENDMRCPIEQSEQVFVALKQLGVDTMFVRFPDEFHGLSRGGRTDRRIARLNHILGWFEEKLK